jgi:hypothetical protein
LNGPGNWGGAGLAQKSFPMISGGIPLVTKWPNGIITYELAILGRF